MLKRNSFKTSLQIWRLSKVRTAGLIGDFGNILNGFRLKSTRALMVLNIEWMQFVLKNCELLQFVRGLHDKNSPL